MRDSRAANCQILMRSSFGSLGKSVNSMRAGSSGLLGVSVMAAILVYRKSWLLSCFYVIDVVC